MTQGQPRRWRQAEEKGNAKIRLSVLLSQQLQLTMPLFWFLGRRGTIVSEESDVICGDAAERDDPEGTAAAGWSWSLGVEGGIGIGALLATMAAKLRH